MKSLFLEYREEWSEGSRALDSELYNALTPIVDKWVGEGYSIRHIQLAVLHAAFEAGLTAAINQK